MSLTNGKGETAQAVIAGRDLERQLKRGGLTATERALLAHNLESGKVQVRQLTRAQAATLAHASAGYVSTAARLTAEQYEQVDAGRLSLSEIHNHKHHKPDLADVLARIGTDFDVDTVIAKLGHEQVLAALDRATAPANGNGARA